MIGADLLCGICLPGGRASTASTNNASPVLDALAVRKQGKQKIEGENSKHRTSPQSNASRGAGEALYKKKAFKIMPPQTPQAPVQSDRRSGGGGGGMWSRFIVSESGTGNPTGCKEGTRRNRSFPPHVREILLQETEASGLESVCPLCATIVNSPREWVEY